MSVQARPDAERTLQESDIDHWVCCMEDDPPFHTYCGIILHDDKHGWADEVDCVVCTDIGDTEWCPVRGVCPYSRDPE